MRRELETGTLAAVPLATDELVRPLGIIHRRGKELASTARRFIELLQSEAQRTSAACDEDAHARNGHPGANGDGEAPDAETRNPRNATPRPGRAACVKAR